MQKDPDSLLERLESFIQFLKATGHVLESQPGLSKQSLENYRKRGTVPNGKTLQAWSITFDLSVDWLLTGQGTMLRGEAKADPAVEELRGQVAALTKELLEVNRQYRTAAEKLMRLSEPLAPYPVARNGEGPGLLQEDPGLLYGQGNQDKNGG